MDINAVNLVLGEAIVGLQGGDLEVLQELYVEPIRTDEIVLHRHNGGAVYRDSDNRWFVELKKGDTANATKRFWVATQVKTGRRSRHLDTLPDVVRYIEGATRSRVRLGKILR